MKYLVIGRSRGPVYAYGSVEAVAWSPHKAKAQTYSAEDAEKIKTGVMPTLITSVEKVKA